MAWTPIERPADARRSPPPQGRLSDARPYHASMKRRAIRVVGLGLALASACARPTSTPAAAAAPRAAIAPPASKPTTCVVEGEGEPMAMAPWQGDLWIERDAQGHAPLVRVTTPSELHASYTDFPDTSVGGRARITVGGGTVPSARVVGWTDLGKRVFTIRRDAAIVPDHLWIASGSPIAIRGLHKRALEVERPGSPTIVARVDCDALEYRPAFTADAPTVAGVDRRVAGRTALRGSPDGPVVYELDVTRLLVRSDESVRGWARIAGRADVLRFDAWVRESDLLPLDERPEHHVDDRHFVGAIRLTQVRPMTASRETALFMGTSPDDAVAIGVLEAHAKVGESKRGLRAEIVLDPETLEPPDGQRFFAAESDLVETR